MTGWNGTESEVTTIMHHTLVMMMTILRRHDKTRQDKTRQTRQDKNHLFHEGVSGQLSGIPATIRACVSQTEILVCFSEQPSQQLGGQTSLISRALLHNSCTPCLCLCSYSYPIFIRIRGLRIFQNIRSVTDACVRGWTGQGA